MKCDTIPDLKKFLSIQEQALGQFSPEVASTVSKLADLYLGEGLLDDAESCYRRALEIRERLNGLHRSELEDSKQSLNKVLALKGDRLVRVSAEMRAEAEAKKATLPEVSQSQSSKSDLHAYLSKTGPHRRLDTEASTDSLKPGSSRRLTFAGAAAFAPTDSSTSLDAVPFSMALTSKPEALSEAIKEACVEVDLIRHVSGSEAPQLADALTRLADLYCRCKRYGDMEPILLEALQIREKRFGANHQLVSTSLKNLGRLYYFLLFFEKALPLFERSLAIRRSVFGANNPRVADVLEPYCKVLRKLNRHQEAHILEQEAHDIRERSGWRV